jgi:hypothetical protein
MAGALKRQQPCIGDLVGHGVDRADWEAMVRAIIEHTDKRPG